MKLTTILLLTASVICSSWAYPAGGHPDDDVEVIAGGNQPGYQPNPSSPPVPHYPLVPSIPSIPSVPTIPVFPHYPYPVFPSYPTFHQPPPPQPTYIPYGWTYNVFDGFSNFLSQIRSQASSAWSRVPSFKPFFGNLWPRNNGTTTSTVKVVGDHKFIINETVHVQQSDFGHVIFKVRTVDIKPIERSDETTEGVDNDDTTETPQVDIDTPNTNGSESGNDDQDDRESVADTGDIDGNRVGSSEVLDVIDNTNEVTADDLLETFEKKETTSSSEKLAESSEVETNSDEDQNDITKESLSLGKEEIEIESLSSENTGKKSEEWSNIELENDQQNTYYEVNNNDNENESDSEDVEQVTYNLANDIAVNQMLADQGATYDPDAEVFDINQFEMNRETSRISSPEEKDVEQESFDYLPYQHQMAEIKRPLTIK